MELTAPQWQAWQHRAASKRPARAARTIWRGVLELLGLGKQDALVEESVSMQLVRLLRGAMADHPVIVASKRRPAPSPGDGRRADIHVLAAPSRAAAGSVVTMRLCVRNTGRATWQTDRLSASAIRLGVQWLGADQRLLDRDFHRHDLSGPVAPGASLEVELSCRVPDARGAHVFKFDLVEEGVAWFEPQGLATARHAIEVT